MENSFNPDKKPSWLDHPLFPRFPFLTIEVFIFALILILAVASRLYNLGERVISHDESLHTYFSWLLYKGNGYEHNPMMHGPLQFHLLALTYFLFGTSDFTARLPHAIFSILTIVMLWKWRRYLGRPGTLLAALFILISPYMLYYGRYARNEVFAGFFGLLMLYAILRYEELGKPRYLYMLTAATVLHFTAKETAFIYAAQALLDLAFRYFGRVTRRAWTSNSIYNAFIILLCVGVLLVGGALGYQIYSKESSAELATQPAAPLNPDQELVTDLEGGFQLSLTSILALGAVLVFLAAGVLLVIGYGWQQIRAERSFDMLMLLGTLVLPQLVAFPIKILGWDPLDYNFTWPSPFDLNAFLQIGMVRTLIVLLIVGGISIALGLWWNRSLWLKNAAIWYAIFTILYTTVFTNGQGFFTGIVGSLGYWLVQQGVQRGGQPWYYYILIQIPIYEFLPFLGMILAVFFGLRRRLPEPVAATETELDIPELKVAEEEVAVEKEQGNHQPFGLLLWWAISSLLAFTVAGEKMPWLTFHIALPMVLLTGWGLGQVIERTDWQQVRERRGWLVVGLIIVFLVSLFSALFTALGATPPFGGKDLVHLQTTATFLLAALAATGSLAGMIYLFKGWTARTILQLGAVVMFGLLAVLTTRAAFRASYIEYDNGTEYLVYAHGARGVKDVMEQVQEISERTAGGLDMVVAYDVSAPDTGISWPFTWYLRDYTQTRPFDQPSKSLRDAPVIIVDQKNFEKIKPVVGDAYYEFSYIRMVWPNMDYFSLTGERVKNAITDPNLRAGILDIWLNRDYDQYAAATGSNSFTLPTWEPSDRMKLYIRKDIAAQIWNYGVSPVSQVQADPYEEGFIILPADVIFGSPGQGNGQFQSPRGIALAPDGSLYVADSRNHRIQHFSADGSFIGSWGSFADVLSSDAPVGTFYEPWGVAVSPDGKWVYVTDTWNHRVQKFTADGTPVKTWGTGIYGSTDPYGLWGPRGIAVSANGNVLVADTGNKRIIIYDKDGNFLSQFGSAGLELGQFDEPVGIAIDQNGILYVTDTWNQRVQSFAPGGDGLTYVPLLEWEISGWYGQSLENKPFIAVDQNGHVFVTDPEVYRVLEFDMAGAFIQTWGEFGIGAENFGVASGIAVDAEGRVWVSDAGNNRLMRFAPPITEPAETVPTETEVVVTKTAPTPEMCRITATDELTTVNLYACPDASCAIVAQAPVDSLLTILSLPTYENWLPVQFGNYLGWIMAEACPIPTEP